MAALLLLGPAAVLHRPLAAWGGLLLCAAGGVVALVYLLGGAAPAALSVPFGLAGQDGTLALDGLSGIFLLLLMVSGLAASAAALDGAPSPTLAAMPVFLGAMALTLLAGDAFMLVAGFELMSLASFVLVATDHRLESVRSACVLYLGMAGLGAVCLIAAMALLGTQAGAGFAAMRAHPPEGLRAAAVLALAMIGPGSKAGLVPLHVWLPPAHAAAPGPGSALMSGVMTKVALYVLIRLTFDLCGPAQPMAWAVPLVAMGAASAVLGAMRANVEQDVKRVLACSTIENVGLIAVGLGLALAARAADLSALAALALGAALLHVLGHGLFKTLLFLGAGAIKQQAHSVDLSRLGGLMRRMPITGACVLLGAACVAGLPPFAGFASEWMLFQSVLAAVRLGGLGLQILVCVLAALMALATALAACAAVRLVGVALLGRPRGVAAAEAVEAGPPMRWALIGLSVLVAIVGVVPGSVLALADPALRLLASTSLADRVSVVVVRPAAEMPGYAPLGVVVLLGLAAAGLTAVLRARAVGGHRTAPAWDGGLAAGQAFVPLSDGITQISGGGASQILRRMLGGTLLGARETVDMPRPGDTRPAIYSATTADPAERFLFAPMAALRQILSGLADRMHFLTVRQSLAVMALVLVAFLTAIAVVEQL